MKKNVRKRVLKKNKNYTIIIFFIALLIIIGIVAYLLIPRYLKKEFQENVEVNYNSNFNYHYGELIYGNILKKEVLTPEIIGKVDTSKIGTYNVKYIFNKKGEKIELDQIVNVVDKIKPEFKNFDGDIIICPNGKVLDAKYEAIDEYDGNLTDRIETKFLDNKLYLSVRDSSGNTNEIAVNSRVHDEEGPVITLIGDKNISLRVGEKYTEKGATAFDNCDGEVNVSSNGSVNPNVAGTYKIKYSAKDNSGNNSEIERKVTVYNEKKTNPSKVLKGAKVIYLTFDDGPSKHTSRLLDVLKKYNVKATFFVTGYGSDSMIKREYNDGHTVGIHSYTHDYCKIYKNVDAFFTDLYKVQNRVKKLTGFTPYLMRFAGGSSNTVSKKCDGGTKIMSKLVREVEARGFTYYDWNVVSGDAGWTTNTTKVYNYVVNSLKSNYSIVLQHDSKGYSVDAVEDIIKYGLANGFTFKKLDSSSPVVHHKVNN